MLYGKNMQFIKANFMPNVKKTVGVCEKFVFIFY